MDGKLYIKKFIRDDGEFLELDGNELYLAQDNTLLVRSDPSTTAVDYTEADGGEMIRQREAVYQQTVNGLIVPKQSSYWQLSTQLARFFRINHYYKIVYTKVSGEMFSISDAWITSGLQIPPVPYEDYSPWSISFTIGNPDWVEYTEDGSGKEIYSNIVSLPLLTAATGGEVWDEVGLVADGVGEEWERGAGGVQTVDIASVKTIYPVWTVVGPCTNPSLQNNTTDTYAEFQGTVESGQTLVVDFAAGTAYLDSALVSRLLLGSISFQPGENMAGFNSEGGATETSTISWNNIIN